MTTKEVQKIGRFRAYWNRNEGGVILTTEMTGNDGNGVHWRALLDGGNRSGGRMTWVVGRASGGGYNVQDCALAEGVRGITGAEGVDWHNPREWVALCKAAGWKMHLYDGAGACVLIPSERVAAEIAAEIEAERKAAGFGNN